jgi:hypothetical protein
MIFVDKNPSCCMLTHAEFGLAAAPLVKLISGFVLGFKRSEGS